jgi:hypothetical protein
LEKNWLSRNATKSRFWDLNFVNKLFIVKINLFEVNFYKVVWIIVCKHLEIYTKTMSRLMQARWLQAYIHFAFGSMNIGL